MEIYDRTLRNNTFINLKNEQRSFTTANKIREMVVEIKTDTGKGKCYTLSNSLDTSDTTSKDSAENHESKRRERMDTTERCFTMIMLTVRNYVRRTEMFPNFNVGDRF